MSSVRPKISLDLNVAKQTIAQNVLTHSIRKMDVSTSEISMTLPGLEITIFKFPDIVNEFKWTKINTGTEFIAKVTRSNGFYL